MSRIRSRNQEWTDLGPTGCRTEPRRYIHGALVTPGPVTGPVMGLWGQGSKKTKAEIDEARKRFHPHGKGKVA